MTSKFALVKGPGKGKVVHVENGAWLSLQQRIEQRDGPYPADPEKPVPIGKQQPLDITVAKR